MLSVCANVSKEVYDYYFGYDLNGVVNALLDTFAFDNLPQMSGKREVELRITVQNELYEKMYSLYGPRSKKISIGRLLEFGYNMDILKNEKFKIYKVEVPETWLGLVSLRKAVRYLRDARKYDKSKALQTIYESLHLYTVQKQIDCNSVYGLVNEETKEEAKDVQSSNL